jgi:hypothetical protein
MSLVWRPDYLSLKETQSLITEPEPTPIPQECGELDELK